MSNLALISIGRKGAVRDGFPEPKPYVVHEGDRARYSRHYWRLPTRLGHDGTLARLWHLGEGVSSVLAVLAVHAHPEAGAEWSHPIPLEHERIATLAGVSRRRVISSLAALRRAGYVRQETRAHPTDNRFRLRTFYVSAELYARHGETYISIDGSLIYDGWALLPSHGARHLRLVCAALAPVRNVAEYTAAIAAGAEGDLNAEELVRGHIEAHAPSLSALSRASGMSRKAVARVMRARECEQLDDLGFYVEAGAREAAERFADLDFYIEEAE
jgi:hypothetical protein